MGTTGYPGRSGSPGYPGPPGMQGPAGLKGDMTQNGGFFFKGIIKQPWTSLCYLCLMLSFKPAVLIHCLRL